MPNTKKQASLKTLSASIKDFDVVVFTDYSGLTHKELESIRSKVKEAHGDYQIVKNSLLKLALAEGGRSQNDNTDLTGPTAVILATEHNLAPLRILYDAAKENDKLKIRGGVWKTDAIDVQKVKRLATLPSREQLIAQLLGQLKTPTTKLVLTLKNPLTKLAIALSQIKEQKAALVS